MIEATRMRSGNAFLIPAIFGSHQSSLLSEISSQFQEECSAEPGRFCIDMRRTRPSSEEFGLRPGYVGDRVHADRLGDDAAPARLERAHDVANPTRLAGRMRAKGIRETKSREGDRKIGAHGTLSFPKCESYTQAGRPLNERLDMRSTLTRLFPIILLPSCCRRRSRASATSSCRSAARRARSTRSPTSPASKWATRR